jgi:hypothetical protein
MKPKYVFIFILNILVSIGLVIAIVVLFSKEQEKERMIQDLEIQRQTDLRRAVEARQELDGQKEFEAQKKLAAQKESEAKRMRTINDDLDKIDARLQRILDVPSGYVDQTKAQRDTQEELLRQLANAVKAEIAVLAGEMQNAGFTNNALLDERLAVFFRNYENKIHDEHISYDYIDLGLKDTDHKRELDADAAKSLQAAFGAKRSIRNLKQK